jgi:pyruvate kinase
LVKLVHNSKKIRRQRNADSVAQLSDRMLIKIAVQRKRARRKPKIVAKHSWTAIIIATAIIVKKSIHLAYMKSVWPRMTKKHWNKILTLFVQSAMSKALEKSQ